VGKSVLLGMMARYTEADVIVVGLIGERGREVKEFIEDILGDEGLARSVVVAAPADAPPLLRMQGANYATAIAEHFRDRGQHVLLLMDSLTRYAMAQREIALAIGEPPATKGYPPSCFAKLPQLVERSGNGAGGGSITAFYTVLTEGDDQQDPIADAARGILDGHIVLSRELAEAGHYPAIDVEKSISRVMTTWPAQHVEAARRARQLLAKHQQGTRPDPARRLRPRPRRRTRHRGPRLHAAMRAAAAGHAPPRHARRQREAAGRGDGRLTPAG
jgi:flagellum-specific ATP synthase